MRSGYVFAYQKYSTKFSVDKSSVDFLGDATKTVEVINLDKEGDPQSINYDMLSVLLLSELKKLKARIEVLEGN